MQNSTVILGGQEWTIEFVTRRSMHKGCWGICRWDKKLIQVRKDLSPKNVLDTLIHEMRHAQHQIAYEAEDWINTTSTELAEGLITTGMFGKNDTPIKGKRKRIRT